MNYNIITKQYSQPSIEITVPEDIDFRNDSELMQILKNYNHVKYTYPHPLEWLPDHITYFNFCDIFAIEFKDKQVYILDNPDSGYYDVEDSKRYSTNNELIKMLTKYKRVICEANVPLDWLPDGITHLEINNQMFDRPLDNLPTSLILLSICGGKQIFDERFFNQPLDNLPVGLKCLYLANLENEILLDNLPPSLEYLLINQREYNLPLDNLPKNMKKVIVLTDNTCIKNDYVVYNPENGYQEIQNILDNIYKIDS